MTLSKLLLNLKIKKTINDVIDWYGNDIVIKEKDDGIYVTLKVNGQAFLYWTLQYEMNIEIVEPVAAKKKYIEMLKAILNKY